MSVENGKILIDFSIYWITFIFLVAFAILTLIENIIGKVENRMFLFIKYAAWKLFLITLLGCLISIFAQLF